MYFLTLTGYNDITTRNKTFRWKYPDDVCWWWN